MSCSTFFPFSVTQGHLHISQCEWFAPPILKTPNLSRASLVRHSLYKLNRIGDKQHPCRTPLPVCTLLVSPPSSRTLTFCCIYLYTATNCNIIVFITVCIYRYIHTTALYYWPNTTGMTHLKIWFSNNDRPYLSSLAPITYPLVRDFFWPLDSPIIRVLLFG